MKELIGKNIQGILVSSDQSLLVFETDGDLVSYETESDCCSETWFADITGVTALLGGTVASVEMIDLPEVEDGRTRQEYDSFYGVKIVTDKGYADIVYRNSSNGHYGGSINLYSGEIPDEMTEILDDWTSQ